MIKIASLSFVFFLTFALYGCRSATEPKTENSNQTANSPSFPKPENAAPHPARSIPVKVAQFADESAAELDVTFGPPLESSAIENGGQYRLYKIAGQSKGLAVRFYGKKAKSFNMILDEPVRTSKEALRQVFDIDVGSSAPAENRWEPLTESYRGTFGGVKFKKVSAKRQESNKGFVFVLAEVAE